MSVDVTPLTLVEAGLLRELLLLAAQFPASKILGNSGEFKHHSTGLDVGDPPLRRTLTGTHADFGRLLGQRAVGVDVDPHLSTTLDVTGHGNTSSLDLTVRHVRWLDSLDAVVTKRHLGATGSHTG